MKGLISIVLAAAFFVGCSGDEDEAEPLLRQCTVPATVRDLTGQDGCGYVFELEDGTKLVPVIVFYCGTPPVPPQTQADPIHTFEFAEGKSVLIEYTLPEGMFGTCMAGPYARITCITETETNTDPVP